MVEVLNSLFLQGLIYKTPTGAWALSVAGDSGLSGTFTDSF